MNTDFTRLVNKDNMLASNYVPQNLVVTDHNENNFHNYVDPNFKPMVEKDVFEQFRLLQLEALKEDIYVIVDSGYRSYDYQKKVYEKIENEKGAQYAKEFVAPPGASEHQTGLAIDIAVMRDGIYSDDISDNDKEFKWMKDNAYNYGFILRYPKGKEKITGYSFEPWHFRYVGTSLATFLYLNELTLEEYYQNKKEHDCIINNKTKQRI